MRHCLLLGLVTLVYLRFIIALGALWMATMQCDLAVLVTLQLLKHRVATAICS